MSLFLTDDSDNAAQPVFNEGHGADFGDCGANPYINLMHDLKTLNSEHITHHGFGYSVGEVSTYYEIMISHIHISNSRQMRPNYLCKTGHKA